MGVMPSGTTPPPGPFGQEVAAILTGHMARRRITQKDLADAAGVSQNRVSKVLRGVTPINISELEAIAALFGITVAEITDEAQRGVETAAAAKRQTPGHGVLGEDPDVDM